MLLLHIRIALMVLFHFAVGQLNQYEEYPSSMPSANPITSMPSSSRSVSYRQSAHSSSSWMDRIDLTATLIVLFMLICFGSVACCYIARRDTEKQYYCCSAYNEIESKSDTSVCCTCRTAQKAIRRISQASNSNRSDVQTTPVSQTVISMPIRAAAVSDPRTLRSRMSAVGFDGAPTPGRERIFPTFELDNDEDDEKKACDDSGTPANYPSDYARVDSESTSAKRLAQDKEDDRGVSLPSERAHHSLIEPESKCDNGDEKAKAQHQAIATSPRSRLFLRSLKIGNFIVRGRRKDAIKNNRKFNMKILDRFWYENARVCVCQGSVVDFSGEAIVNAANEEMLGGNGVDGAISRAGGPILRQLREQVPIMLGHETVRCQTGDAQITLSGYPHNKLKCDYVIHAVGPDYRLPQHKLCNQGEIKTRDALLFSAYAKSMKLCKKYEIKSVGFCLLSAGIYRGSRSLEEVIAKGLQAIHQHMFAGSDVFVVAYSDDEAECLYTVAQNVLRGNQRCV